MLENKKVILEDHGVSKQFIVTTLGAIQALKLLRELVPLLADTELIRSVVLQQFIHQTVVGSGVKVEGVDKNQLNELLQMELPMIVGYLVQSVAKGLTDSNLEILVAKCMDSVSYINGSVTYTVTDALQHNMIKDFAVILTLMYEVFLLNFGGAIERLKKYLGQPTAIEKTAT